MTIRTALPQDAPAIRDVLVGAFPTNTEAGLVEQLRADGDTAIELVAVEDAGIVGHILFTVLDAPFRALALAPLAIRPERQKSGVGSTLVQAGHAQAGAEGWDAIFVLGDPAYYSRFGYSVAAAEPFASPYAGPHFMMLAFRAPLPQPDGEISYPKAFKSLA